MTQQLQNFQMFTRCLNKFRLVSPQEDIWRHPIFSLQSSQKWAAKVWKHSGYCQKYLKREKHSSSNNVTQISMCGKTKFSKSAYKVLLQKTRVL
jgi:sarcosine oxidase delta subunit